MNASGFVCEACAAGRAILPHGATLDAILSAGYTTAEARSIAVAQYQTLRCPLHEPPHDNVLACKAAEGWPLLPHERRELRRRMVETWATRLRAKGAAWFARWYGAARLEATRVGTLCEDDIESTCQ